LDPLPDIFMILTILELTHKEELPSLMDSGFLTALQDRQVHQHGIYGAIKHVSEHTRSATEQ